jgi:hypothetical protein
MLLRGHPRAERVAGLVAVSTAHDWRYIDVRNLRPDFKATREIL